MSALPPKSHPTLPNPEHDHVQGPVDAPLALVEYGDYQCPYCGEAYPIIKAVQKHLGNRLCFAFRNFPLSNIHPYAEHAAEAAESAGAQGKYWEMHDLLFENQDELDDDALAQYAESLGLDAPRLMAEVQTGAYSARIHDDFKGGVRSGVNGTPTLFINGVRFNDPPDVDALVATLTKSDRTRR